MLENKLIKFGLDKTEANVFLVLLELGPSGISEIAHKADMNRTTLYAVFDRLAEKDLLVTSIRGKRKVYSVQSPEKIKTMIQEHLGVFDEILPELLNRTKEGKNKPVLKFYKGIEGIRTVFLDSLEAKENTLVGFSGIEALSISNKSLLNFWEKEYIPKRKKRNKFVRLVIPENERGLAFRKKDKECFRETKMVSGLRYNFESEIHAYDDTVSLISYSSGEEFALEIISQPIANTVKMLFQIVWASAY